MKTINVKITHYPDMYCECCEWNSYKDLSITCDGITRNYTQNDHWGGEWNGSYEELYQFVLESLLGEPFIIEDWEDCYGDGSPYEYATGLLPQNPVRLVIKEDLQYLVVNGKTYVTLFHYEEDKSLVGIITGMVRLLGYFIEIEEEVLEE